MHDAPPYKPHMYMCGENDENTDFHMKCTDQTNGSSVKQTSNAYRDAMQSEELF
jgi:hypothetical protein